MDTFWSQFWWVEKKYNAHGAALETVRSIEAENTGRTEDFKHYATLYKDRTVTGFEAGDWKKAIDDLEPPMTFNVIRATSDALTAKITAHRPAPKFLTSGGSEALQERAKKQEKFVSGIIYQQKVYEKATKQFRDGCVFGTGVLKIFPKDNEVCVEVVHPSRIIVDNNAALDGDVRTLYQKQYIDKETLFSMFPKSKGAVESAKVKSMTAAGTVIRDMVEVYEAWHKGVGNIRGRHMIFIEGHTFFDEDWDEKDFPFCFIKYSDDLVGWYGVGLTEQLVGLQLEINTLVQKIKRNMGLLSVPYILKHKSSEVEDEHLMTNEDARLVEWTGNVPPQVITPPAMAPEVYQHLEYLYRKAFEIAGVSQLTATGKKPSGLDSAVAMRTFHDIETQRFSVIAKQWEQLFVDIAKQILRVAKQLSTEEGYEVKFADSEFVETINWKDVSMDEDSFILKVHPASSLPQTPAARMQTVVELMQAGMIDSAEGRQLLDYPDLEKSNKLATAAIDDLEATFEHFLAGREYIEPIIYQNLALGIKIGTSYYLRGKINGAKQSNLDKIARWLQEAAEMLSPPPPPEAIPGMVPPMPGPEVVPPPAGPTAPPQVAGEMIGLEGV